MKIGINCGHTKSGTGSGAVGIINESVETREVGKAMMTLLKKGGHTVVDCTVDKASSTNTYLSKTVDIANKNDLDLFISIHFNAGKGKGTECYTWKGEKSEISTNICNELHKLGFVDRGVKDGSSLYVIKNTKAKAVLVEVCFVDNSSDVTLYKKKGSTLIANAICKAIIGEDILEKDTDEYTDIGKLSTRKKINEIAKMGIFPYKNDELEPDKPVTREELAVVTRNLVKYITGK